jgi:hypothetical protein
MCILRCNMNELSTTSGLANLFTFVARISLVSQSSVRLGSQRELVSTGVVTCQSGTSVLR